MVSGTISRPLRGTFHLSLTVLVHYRSLKVFSLGRWPGHIPTELPCSAVLWKSTEYVLYFKYGAFTLYGNPFQNFLLLKTYCYVAPNVLTCVKIWASPFSLAATNGIPKRSLFLRVLRCFSSPSSYPDLAIRIPCQWQSGFSHSDIAGW